MKDYYAVLGVSHTAHQSDIKRAYRRLVQKLHPDVNPNPDTQELVKEVNEAYDVLGDETKRKEYDYRLENPFSTVVVDEPPPHRDPYFKRKGTYRPRTSGASQPKGPTQRDLMEKSMPYLKPVAWVGSAIVLFLCIDFFLPRALKTETIAGFSTNTYRRSIQITLITETRRTIRISPEDLQALSVRQELIFVESKWLGVLMKVQTTDGSYTIKNLATLYSNYVFVPILLLIGCAIWFSPLGNLEFRFNLGIVNAFVLIFTLILMMNA